MFDVLMLVRDHGPGNVELAVRGALAPGRTPAAPSPSSPAARSARDDGARGGAWLPAIARSLALTGCT
jgi:hypothetical protein